MALPPPPRFTVADNLAEWNVSAASWFAAHDATLRAKKLSLHGIASAAVVFDPDGRVLLIQRASHDSMPDRWEVPGGAVDAADATVLHGAARELWEEAGLVATRFRRLVNADGELHMFPNRNRSRWFCRFAFVVDVDDCARVRLDPSEHQDFLWASRDEVAQQRVGDREIPITHQDMQSLILDAFRLRDEAR